MGGTQVNVPMADLQKQYRSIKDETDKAVLAVLERCQFGLGDNVKALEAEIAKRSGAKYGVAVGSGTDALVLSLAALGIGRGDEVITTPFTFVATTEAIVVLGGTPVYADIDPLTFNLDPEKIEEKITPRTKAILPVHLFGQMADTKRIMEIAAKHGLKVVWDGAQAIGCESHGQPVGAYADTVTLSFFPTKNLGGAGDGGMILTNNDELAEKLQYLRFHGGRGSYSYKYVGYCSRLDEIQAAILRVKLQYLDDWNETRRSNAEFYGTLLSDSKLVLPVEEPFNKHVYHQYTVRCSEREKLREYLTSQGISTGIYYPGPLHLEEAYRYLGYKDGDLPEVERACREVMSLPVFPEMTDEQLAWVAHGIREFYE